MAKGKIQAVCSKWPIFGAAAVLVLAALLLLSRLPGQTPELVPAQGVLDLTGADLAQTVYRVRNNWDYYPNALYGPQDFAAGTAVAGGDGEAQEGQPRYGTYRLVIQAQPERYYALCSYSIDYSTRVFVNGVEAASFGAVADNAAQSVPRIGYMTIPLYSGPSGVIEVIYQFSNFVHRDGGFIPPTYLSTPQNIQSFQAGINLVSLSLSGGLLALFAYFLLCAAVRRRLPFLFLSLCCLMAALRNQDFLVVHALPPGTSWYVSYRVFMGVTILLPAMVLLLLRSMYPRAVRRPVTAAYGAAMAVAVVLDILLPTQLLTTVCAAAWGCGVPYLLCLLYGAIRSCRAGRRPDQVDGLTVGAGGVLVLSVVLEAVYVNDSSLISRCGLIPLGMLVFDLLMAVSISLRFTAQEAALAESRSRSQLLEQINTMNLDFLHKVAHELKTPLTVISGYAQLTRLQLSAGQASGETQKNLKTIQDEAQRLADMVTELMAYSHGEKSPARLSAMEVGALLNRVEAVCTPMCLKNHNRIRISGGSCADIYGSEALLLQVFINLIINANRHTHGGLITVSASDRELQGYVVFRVADTGDGIDGEPLNRLFDSGYSGDGSSGLGLAICREAVEAHGGTLAVERTGPEGTVFAFTVLRKEEAP